jgi:hypothetical protein
MIPSFISVDSRGVIQVASLDSVLRRHVQTSSTTFRFTAILLTHSLPPTAANNNNNNNNINCSSTSVPVLRAKKSYLLENAAQFASRGWRLRAQFPNALPVAQHGVVCSYDYFDDMEMASRMFSSLPHLSL